MPYSFLPSVHDASVLLLDCEFLCKFYLFKETEL